MAELEFKSSKEVQEPTGALAASSPAIEVAKTKQWRSEHPPQPHSMGRPVSPSKKKRTPNPSRGQSLYCFLGIGPRISLTSSSWLSPTKNQGRGLPDRNLLRNPDTLTPRGIAPITWIRPGCVIWIPSCDEISEEVICIRHRDDPGTCRSPKLAEKGHDHPAMILGVHIERSRSGTLSHYCTVALIRTFGKMSLKDWLRIRLNVKHVRDSVPIRFPANSLIEFDEQLDLATGWLYQQSYGQTSCLYRVPSTSIQVFHRGGTFATDTRLTDKSRRRLLELLSDFRPPSGTIPEYKIEEDTLANLSHEWDHF